MKKIELKNTINVKTPRIGSFVFEPTNGSANSFYIKCKSGTSILIKAEGATFKDGKQEKELQGGSTWMAEMSANSYAIEISNKYNIELLNMSNSSTSYRVLEYTPTFGYMPNLKTLYIINCSIVGDFAELLGRCIGLEDVKIGNNSITGSIETFVSAQRKNGRTTCESFIIGNFNSGSNNITFKNSKPATNSTLTLSWTENTITLGGVTENA